MRRLLPRALRGRLTLWLLVLVSLSLLAVGIISSALVSSTITGRVHDQLTSSLASFDRMVDKSRRDDASHHETSGAERADASSGTAEVPQPEPKPDKPLVEFTSQSPGNVIAVLVDGVVDDCAVFSDEAPAPLSDEAIAALEAQQWVPGERIELDLPGLGAHLAESRLNDQGQLLVAAVSLAPERAAVTTANLGVLAIGLLALLGTGLGTILLVRSATAPLERVAGTADEVARMSLAHGTVAGIPRLGSRDTDPATEAGRVGDALNRLLDHIDQALATRAETDRRMRQFVTDASHELRTPLAAIQGYAELTRQESELLPRLTETSLARIEAESARMSDLVGDLLLLARLDEGQGGLHFDRVDVGEIALNAVNDARTVAPEQRWLAQVPADPLIAEVDQAALTQVLSNLLRNAQVHTPPGTEVRLAVEQRGGEVAITVTDTGPGVEPELRERIFERFTRADRSRSRRAGSSGLGLAIVAALVAGHRGTVELLPSSVGAVFEVVLPLRQEAGIS